MSDEVYLCGPSSGSWIITVSPTESTIPKLPFLQPGNFFGAYDGEKYRITASTMDQFGEDEAGRYYKWVYKAELV